MFVVGSYCFLDESPQVLEIGDILYILASCVYLGVSLYSMREYCQAKHFQSLHERTEDDMEFGEHVCYVASCLVFTAGTILYWPHLYRGHEDTKLWGEFV